MDGKSFVSGMAVGALILTAGIVAGGAAQQPKGPAPKPTDPQDVTFRTVNASAINIVNNDGGIVAMLQSGRNGGELRLSNNASRPVVVAGAGGRGGEVAVADTSGTQRVRLNNEGSVEVFSDDGKLRGRVAAFKTDGNVKSTFSGQFIAFDRNEAVVEKIPN